MPPGIAGGIALELIQFIHACPAERGVILSKINS